MTLKVKRGDEEIEVKATLGKRPPAIDRGDFQNTMGSELSERRPASRPSCSTTPCSSRTTAAARWWTWTARRSASTSPGPAGQKAGHCPTEVVRPLIAELEAGKYPAPKLEKISAFAPKIKDAEDTLKKLQEDKAATEKKIKEAEENLKKLKDQEKAENEKK